MINKLKHNTRIKLISLLSSVILWLYVIEIVDPQDVKLFEDVPIVISNISDIKEKDFVIYPEQELTSDVSVSGKLSNVQKIKKENIHIYGQINNPIEGQNQVYLKVTTSESVTSELKDNIKVVNLDKIVSEDKEVEIQLEGKSKINVSKTYIENGKNEIAVSGPRTLVNKVNKIEGVLDVGSRTNDFSSKIKLIPIDENGDEVKGVKLEYTTATVRVSILSQKTVPIKLKFKEDVNSNPENKKYVLSQDSILIKGSKSIVDKTEYIQTKDIDLSTLKSNEPKDIDLNIPDGIVADNKYITIKLDEIKLQTKEFKYKNDEIEIRNKDNVDSQGLVIPSIVDVSVRYADNIPELNKSSILLYIDLSKKNKNGKYDIYYQSKYTFNEVIIEPNEI